MQRSGISKVDHGDSNLHRKLCGLNICTTEVDRVYGFARIRKDDDIAGSLILLLSMCRPSEFS